LGRKSKRGRKLGKLNSRKIERGSEKINKDSMDKERWERHMPFIRGNGRNCTNEVKESRQVHICGNVNWRKENMQV
jgi:hypothetical protein